MAMVCLGEGCVYVCICTYVYACLSADVTSYSCTVPGREIELVELLPSIGVLLSVSLHLEVYMSAPGGGLFSFNPHT